MLRAVALVVGLCAVFGLVLYVYYSGDTVRTTNSNEQPANYRALAQFSPTDVFFVNPQVGWLVLTGLGDQRILATRNGGKTWYMQLALPVRGVQFVDDHNGWGYIPPQLNPASAMPTPTDSRTTCDCLIVTHDGGQSWQQLPPAPNSLQNFTFVNDRVGWAATGTSGDRGFESGILRTTDGAASWQEVTIPSEIASSAASLIGAVDDRTAWLSFCTIDCTKRPLAVTHDGGATWESLASPCDGPNLARPGEFAPNVTAYFLSASEGWLLCGGELAVDQQAKALYRTSDSGDHWLLLAESEGPGMPPASGSLSRLGWVGYSNIQFLNSNEGWLAVGGPSGGPFVTHDGGVTWKDTRESQRPASRVFFLGDGLHGWALTADSLLSTEDDGASWRKIYPPSSR